MEIMEEYHPKTSPITGQPIPNEKVEEIAKKIVKRTFNNIENQIKNYMENKELDLIELLKGCEGEIIFLPDDGECEIVRVSDNEVTLIKDTGKIYLTRESLILACTGFAFAYPSEESFKQYPLDAVQAWKEWKESRKPKRWRAKKGEKYYCFTEELQVYPCCDDYEIFDNSRHEHGNYFRTEELTEEAIKGVKEYLKKFHEEHKEELI